jgi:single-stranded-DNA-specific exonuclease
VTKWIKTTVSQNQVKDVATRYGCDLLTASVLMRRGISAGEDIKYFLEDDPRHLHMPFLLPDMEKAVNRILAAKEHHEKVLVFGDRDVDGITSTVLVTSFLSGIDMAVQSRIPTGDDPYGLSITAVEEFAGEGGTLIITVDCGVSNVAEINRAHELGIDVVVTDHHNPQELLPTAYAIVNPKCVGSRYPFHDLAGCGVAYKLVSALRFALKSTLYGKPVYLLNTRPAVDAYTIEVAKVHNLVVVDTLTETVIPGMVSSEETRLPSFLEGNQVLVWDLPLQKRTLAKLFGEDNALQMIDARQDIVSTVPHLAGKSLLRIKELSKIARYADTELTELDVFINLFISTICKRDGLFSADDTADLQLVALGTVADIMPLRDENRIMIRYGLAALQEKPRSGLSDLIFKLGLAGRHIATVDLAWQICPAINAAGRMGSPEKAIRLFLEADPTERDRLASELVSMNEERKKLGVEGWAIVEPMIEKGMADYDNAIALAYGENIYRGITGIMASRAVNRFDVPALVASFSEGTVVGSLRSTRGYDVCTLLRQCEDLLTDWGGHNYAAGFSMTRDNWEPLLRRLKTLASTIELEEAGDEQAIAIDAELPGEYLGPDIFTLVDRFEPFGAANEPLTFLARNLLVTDIILMGKTETKHVKLTLDTGTYKWPAIYWSAADRVKRDFDRGSRVDVVFRLARNWYNGTETPQIMVSDLKLSTAESAPQS